MPDPSDYWTLGLLNPRPRIIATLPLTEVDETTCLAVCATCRLPFDWRNYGILIKLTAAAFKLCPLRWLNSEGVKMVLLTFDQSVSWILPSSHLEVFCFPVKVNQGISACHHKQCPSIHKPSLLLCVVSSSGIWYLFKGTNTMLGYKIPYGNEGRVLEEYVCTIN